MKSTTSFTIHRYQQNQLTTTDDLLAIEEPLEIQLASSGQLPRSISITMRTPGQDEHLAVGFLFTEGILHEPSQIERVQMTDENVIQVYLAEGVTVDTQRLERHFYTSSSCGVCGKTSIEAVRTQSLPTIPPGEPGIAAALITGLSDKLRQQQQVFAQTGGIHAAGLFNHQGQLMALQEDVGRHNAVDKLIGQAFSAGWLPLHQHLIMVSGRASFELVQKAAMAGIPILVAVGAPSSLAIELANEANMTIVGFARHQQFNIYCGAERILA